MKLKEKYRAFREWQKRPYQVAPLRQQEHTCATCGTTFQGNYCPRCGQSSFVGRYSLKTALLLFLDVWGLGNRGMFRSIRDLLLRPGYMIRDYLCGMQMAYFPPFKMFFLLATLSILVDSGFNIKGENRLTQMVNNMSANVGDDYHSVFDTTKSITLFLNDHQTVIMLVWLLALSLPLYLFFRRCPAVPDFRYPEFFVGMVYVNNLTILISIAMGLLCVNSLVDGLFSYILSIIALKQLTGYSYVRTILSHAAAIVVLFFFIILIAFFGSLAYGIFVGFSTMNT